MKPIFTFCLSALFFCGATAQQPLNFKEKFDYYQNQAKANNTTFNPRNIDFHVRVLKDHSDPSHPQAHKAERSASGPGCYLDSLHHHSWVGSSWTATGRALFNYDGNGDPTLATYYDLDSLGGAWIPNNKIAQNYDASRNLTLWQFDLWSGLQNTWTPQTKSLISYDAANNVTGVHDFYWYGGSWKNSYVYSASYSPANLPLIGITQVWDTTANAWENNSKTTYTYDANNNCTEVLYSYWDTVTNNWLAFQKHSYTYNNAGSFTQLLMLQWNTNLNTWENQMRYTRTFDNNQNLLDDVQELWNVNQWKNQTRRTFTYDGNNNMLSHKNEIWTGALWQNTFRVSTTYDAQNNPLLILNEIWEVSSAAWKSNTRVTRTFDAANNELSKIVEIWNLNSTNTWDNFNKELFWYNCNTVGLTAHSSPSSLKIYPNPVSDKFNIEREGNRSYEVIITNSLGQVVYSANETDKAAIDISHLSPGIYFVAVKDKGVLKVVKE